MIPLDRVRAMLATATPSPIDVHRCDADGGDIDYQLQRGAGHGGTVLGYASDRDGSPRAKADATLWSHAPDLARDVLTLAAALTTAREERDAARAEADALRAIVEGRTVAPTPADVAAHALAHPIDDTGPASNGARRDATTGLWLCAVDGEGIVVMALAVETDDQGPCLMAWSSDYGWCGTGDIRRAWPLDASGRPCPWPTVAAEAATGAALAREGR